MAFANIAGLRFGRLIALERQGSGRDQHAKWLCQCDCGNQALVLSNHLKIGAIQSCGCWRRESRFTHRQTGSKIYKIWCNMLQRCNNPKNRFFKRYGGRGIKVHYANFEEFYAEMGDPPTGLSIDRKDNERGYEPGNCRWATQKQQVANRSVCQ